MSDANRRGDQGGDWDAPEIGRRYRDNQGGEFLLFSLTRHYIYIEYGSGNISVLCRPEWSGLAPRAVTPTMGWAASPPGVSAVA